MKWDDIDELPRPVGVLLVSKRKSVLKKKSNKIAYYNNNCTRIIVHGVREAGGNI